MPQPTRTRQGKVDDLPVPSGSQDPAERKRVLNILAQRRYRKRKREHVKALESQVTRKTSVNGQPEIESSVRADGRPILEEDANDITDLPQQPSSKRPSTEESSPEEWLDIVHTTMNGPQPAKPALYSDFGHTSLGCQAQSLSNFDLSEDVITADLSLEQVPMSEPAMIDWAASSTSDLLCQAPFSTCQPPLPWTWDPLVLMPSISLPSTPTPDSSPSENISTPPTNLSSLLSNYSPVARNPTSRPPSPSHYPHALQTRSRSRSRSRSPSIPPTILIPQHNLLNSLFSIASLFNLLPQIWSLTANSPFNTASPPLLPPNLPPHLHPTPSQKSLPHHPLLDILPWPSVRTKLILMFSTPLHLRPPAAQSPTALIDFAEDLEDSAEGVTVWGESPFEVRNWEVGSKVWEKWWWAFDGEIVRRSNEWRRERGKGRLVCPMDGVGGEVT